MRGYSVFTASYYVLLKPRGYMEISWLPSVISGITLAIVTALARYVHLVMKEMRQEWAALRESQRNQLKASIVRSYEEAQRNGYITPMELETMNRRADSYFALGGNNYVHALIDNANHKLVIRGELPPNERKAL